MTYEESEDMSFWLSRMESLVKGFVSKGDLEESINNLSRDLEKSIQGSLKRPDLSNLQTLIEERMEENGIKIEERMEENVMNIEEMIRHMEDNIQRIVKILQHQEENIPKEDDVGQGTHEELNSAHDELPSMNKHDLIEFDSNMGSNQGWLTRGLQLPKIDMRKFDG